MLESLSYQVGLDVATSLSVISAAAAYIRSESKKRKQNIALRKDNFIDDLHMRNIDKLTDMFNSYVSSRIKFERQLKDGGDTAGVNSLVEEANRMHSYISSIAIPVYESYGCDREATACKNFLDGLVKWNQDFIR